MLGPPPQVAFCLGVGGSATKRGTSCVPIAPVAPATNTLIIDSLIEDYLHPQVLSLAGAARPQRQREDWRLPAGLKSASRLPSLHPSRAYARLLRRASGPLLRVAFGSRVS